MSAAVTGRAHYILYDSEDYFFLANSEPMCINITCYYEMIHTIYYVVYYEIQGSSHDSGIGGLLMDFFLANMAHIQNFFRLDFLFSGLEVSSTVMFFSRLAAFLLFGAGIVWGLFKIILKLLDCLETFSQTLSRLPGSFYLALLFVVPLSPNSIASQWIGYIILALCLLAAAVAIGGTLALWKYGVDQTIRLFDTIRLRASKERTAGGEGAQGTETAVPSMGVVPDPERSQA